LALVDVDRTQRIGGRTDLCGKRLGVFAVFDETIVDA